MDSQNSDALDLLLGANISFGELKVNLFFAVYIVICFICYMIREDDRSRQSHLAIYFSFATFAAFCALVPIRSYWIILFTPFLAILTALKKGNRLPALIADTFAGVGGGLYFLVHHWIFSMRNIPGSLLMRYYAFPEGTEQKYEGIAGLLDEMGLGNMKYAFFAVFIGSVAFALFTLYPRKNNVVTDKTSEKRHESWILLARPAILLGVMAIMLYCQFATMPTIKYGLKEYTETDSGTNIMYGSSVSRSVVFDSDFELTEMTVHLDTWAYRAARAFVGVRMSDTESGEILYDGSVAIVSIEKDRASFDLDKIAVSAGKEYTVEVYPITPELAEGGTVYPYVDADGKLAVTFR